MSFVEDLKVGGTSILSVPSLSVEDWAGLLATGSFRGANITFPGTDGEASYAKPRDAYDFAIPLNLGPEDGSGAVAATASLRRAQFLANYAALQALFPSNVVALTRVMSSLTTPFHVDTTCNGEFLGFTLTEMVGEDVCRGALLLRNLDGAWA